MSEDGRYLNFRVRIFAMFRDYLIQKATRISIDECTIREALSDEAGKPRNSVMTSHSRDILLK